MSVNEMPERIARIIRENLSGVTSTDPDIRAAQEDDLMRTAELIAADLCASGQQVRALVEWAADIFRNCTVTDGCCCCGDNMEGHPHPMSAGHSPVDHGSYVADKWMKAYATLTPQPEAATPTAPASGRVKVPDGQTPLNDKLSHPLLDVFNEGIAARDNGTGSPYHGHSLEHCLHAAGWVQRDLRLALDATKVATPTAQEAVPVAWRIKDTERCTIEYTALRDRAVGRGAFVGVQVTPLYAHPPQPSVSVAQALRTLLTIVKIARNEELVD